MPKRWQDSLTWTSGLFSEIPVSRWQSISGSEAVEIFVFEKRNKNLPPHPSNLVFLQTLHSRSPSVKTSLLKDPEQYMCIAVDTSLRTFQVDCSFTTSDQIRGSVVLYVDYQISNAKTVLMEIDDVLTKLSLRCHETINDLAESHRYTDISRQSVKEAIKRMKVDDFPLVVGEISIPNSIEWPPSIMEPLRNITVARVVADFDAAADAIKFEKEKKYSRLLVDKLNSMGITHSAAIMRVLARYDADVKTILDSAQHYAEMQGERQKEAKEFLVWLINEGKVPRIELAEDLVPNLLRTVAENLTQPPDPVASLLIAPEEAPSRLADAHPETPPAIESESESVPNKQAETEQTDHQEAGTHSHSIRRKAPRDHSSYRKQTGHSVTRRPHKPK